MKTRNVSESEGVMTSTRGGNGLGEFRYISKHNLHVDHSYQQQAKLFQAKQLAREWDQEACATLVVVERANHKLYIVDGQQRHGGAMLRDDVDLLPCRVFKSRGVEDEAKLFLMIDTGRRQVSALDKYHASLTAGDEDAWFVEDTLDLLGLTASPNGKDKRTVGCIEALLNKSKIDQVAFRRVLTVASALAAADDQKLAKVLFLGLWYLDRNLNVSGINAKRIRDRLHKVGAAQLERRAKARAEADANHGERVYGEGMLQAVNKGLTVRFEWKS